jgi:hypothetical protein
MDKSKHGADQDKQKHGADKTHGKAQGKPQPQDIGRTGLGQPGGGSPEETGRPDQPDKGRESGERKPDMDREGRERSDRDAGAGRPVQLDPDEGGGEPTRR